MTRLGAIWAIIRKDLTEMSRDRFYLVMSLIGLIFFVLIFWLMPDSVDETVTVGAFTSGADILPDSDGQGISWVAFESRAELENAVIDGTDGVALGLALPGGFVESVAANQPTSVEVLVTAASPPELRDAMRSLVKEMAFALAGYELPVSQLGQEEIVLGNDRVGNQVSLQEKIRPMLAFFVLMIEMMSLAAIIANEVQHRTVSAVLTTPARLSDFLVAKIVVGTVVAFIQVTVVMLLIRSLAPHTVLLLTIFLLGGLLITAFALIAGSYGKDFITVVFWSILFLIPLMIPAFGVLFPGSASGFVKFIPSYGLVDAIVGTSSYGEGWVEALPNLAVIGAWIVVAYLIALAILRRKVESL